MGQSRKTSKAARRRKDVWSTLLQIGLWFPTSESRLYHRPCGADHHSHCDHRQCGQILKECDRRWGILRGQRRLHRAHHQALCLRRLLWDPLLHPPLHRGENEASCLLIFWILITLGCSIKYLYVFFVSDWTS